MLTRLLYMSALGAPKVFTRFTRPSMVIQAVGSTKLIHNIKVASSMTSTLVAWWVTPRLYKLFDPRGASNVCMMSVLYHGNNLLL